MAAGRAECAAGEVTRFFNRVAFLPGSFSMKKSQGKRVGFRLMSSFASASSDLTRETMACGGRWVEGHRCRRLRGHRHAFETLQVALVAGLASSLRWRVFTAKERCLLRGEHRRLLCRGRRWTTRSRGARFLDVMRAFIRMRLLSRRSSSEMSEMFAARTCGIRGRRWAPRFVFSSRKRGHAMLRAPWLARGAVSVLGELDVTRCAFRPDRSGWMPIHSGSRWSLRSRRRGQAPPSRATVRQGSGLQRGADFVLSSRALIVGRSRRRGHSRRRDCADFRGFRRLWSCRHHWGRASRRLPFVHTEDEAAPGLQVAILFDQISTCRTASGIKAISG